MITLDFTNDQGKIENPTEFSLIWGKGREYISYDREDNPRVAFLLDSEEDSTNAILKSEIQPLIEALQHLEKIME